MLFKKCVLEKQVGRFRQHQTAWIPEELATLGMLLGFRIQADIWDHGWLVQAVEEPAADIDPSLERDWKVSPRSVP